MELSNWVWHDDQLPNLKDIKTGLTHLVKKKKERKKLRLLYMYIRNAGDP